MQPMERLGSYISRGVYTVSGPFHPFGGAVDIVVVEQQDESFKSSPWYVRFGKFQGVLKAKEKVVSISVNGVDADFHMYLDHKGEAFFLREVDAENGDSVMYPSSSSDETDSRPQGIKRPLKSESCNFDSEKSNSVAQIDISNDKLLVRTNSRRSRLLGFIFGRRSMKGNDCIQGKVDDHDISRVDSLERAEIAANLLEVKWSTNLGRDRPPRKNSTKIKESSSRRDNMENVLDRCKLNDEACLCSKQQGFSCSKPEFVGLGEEESKFLSCLSAPDKAVENCVVGESFTEGKTNMITEISTVVDAAEDTEPNTNVKEVVYGSTRSDLQVASVELGTHIEEQLNGEEVSGSTTVDMPVYGISEGEFVANGVQSLVYCKKSESSMVGMDCSSEQTHELLYLASGGCQQVHVHAEMLHATTVLLPEITKTEDDAENVGLGMPEVDVSEFHSQQTDCFHLSVSNYGRVEAKDLPTLPNPQTVNLDSGLCSLKKVQSTCVGTTDEINNKENDVPSMLSYPMTSVGDGVLSNATSITSPTISEEECYLFGDFDVCQITDQREGSISLDHVDKEDQFSSVDSIEKVNQLVDASHNSHSSPESSTTENQSPESSTTENQRDDLHKSRETHSPIIIPRNKVVKKEIELQTISLPNISSHSNSLSEDVHYPLSQSLDSKSKSLKWRFPDKDCSKHLKSDGDKENPLLHEEPGDNDNHSSGEFKGTVLNPPIGNPSRLNPSPGGNWGLWPFSFRRSRSGKAMLPAPSDAKSTTSGTASESTRSTDADKNEQKPNQTKKKVRVKIPTSEQLASLNLKEGRNIVTFTFSTAMLGKQQVDAQIYLWKWNTRIVISDVDGTITRSDVLGQFMPMVGVDWSQTGVAHLFSAIKENGYHLLFLSARSISQAYHTRQFLLNLKQNGKVLPDGPVLISPDGLFPSLYREVIRRAPHEFKIACLEDIRALFPSDCNPFYAGFGNRDTDEISYLKIGIPKGKIFIINPKGEVAVNRYLDTKSYTSLHALVNGMFPLTNSSEQEDFNSWNFWRLPPPVIDI